MNRDRRRARRSTPCVRGHRVTGNVFTQKNGTVGCVECQQEAKFVRQIRK